MAQHMHNPERPEEARSSEEGAMLLELLVGASISIVALVATMALVLNASLMRRQNAETTLALTAAANILEELRTIPTDQLTLRNGSGFETPSLSGTSAGLQPMPKDTDKLPGEVHITLDSAGSGTSVYHVVAKVKWLGPTGPRKIELETLIGERSTK